MHADIFHVLLIWSDIILGGKPGQTITENEDTERIHPGHHYIYSQIEFQPIYEVGTAQVPLNYAFIVWIYVLEFSGEEDAFALGEAFGFYDVGSGFAFGFRVEVGLELLVLEGEGPGEGEEVVVFRAFLAHPHEVFGEHVFPSKGEHAGKVIDFLMMFHLHEDFRGDVPVGPPEVPLRVILVGFDFDFELLGHFGDNFILTIWVRGVLPETLMRMRSKRMCWVQLGTNLGMRGSEPLSSLSRSLSLFFLFIDSHDITYNYIEGSRKNYNKLSTSFPLFRCSQEHLHDPLLFLPYRLWRYTFIGFGFILLCQAIQTKASI